MILYVQFAHAVQVVGAGNITRWSRDADANRIGIKDAGAYLHLWSKLEAGKGRRTRIPMTSVVYVTEDDVEPAAKKPEKPAGLS